MSATENSPFAPPDPRTRIVDPATYEDGHEHVREQAEVMETVALSSLGNVATQLAKTEAEEAAQRGMEIARQRAAEQETGYAAEVQRSVAEMIVRLPHAKVAEVVRNRADSRYNPLSDRFYGTERHPNKEIFFESDSPQDIWLAEAQAWWLPEAARTVLLRVKKSDWETGEYPIEDTPPFFVVGERLLEAADDKSDAVTELLLMRATEDSAQHDPIRVMVSMRKRELADELARKKYMSSAGGGEVEAYREEDRKFRLRAPDPEQKHGKAHVLTIDYKHSYGAEPDLADEPLLKSRRDEYWERLESKIDKKGLPASWFKTGSSRHPEVPPAQSQLTTEEIRSFNVAHYAQELAIVLGDEAAYAATVGREVSGEAAAERAKPKWGHSLHNSKR